VVTEERSKVFRDPIYGYIEASPEELKVISLPVFQRLRWVSQVAFCDLAYPSAKHTRFSHSLGVMHLCGLYADHLAQFGLMDDHKELRRLLRLAGLLHDIGHWPFSHVAEPTFAEFVLKDEQGWEDSHVRWGQRIIRNPDFGISRIIGEQTAEYVAALIGGQGEQLGLHPALDHVLKGLFSADRLDYLKRDAHHAGTTEYAIIDTQRIIDSTFVEGRRLQHLQKGLFALEGAILSYAYMYRALYHHRVARGAACVFETALYHAFSDGHLGDETERYLEPSFFSQFTDYRLLSLIAERGGEEANGLIRALLARQIPKCLLDYPDLDIYRGPLANLAQKVRDYAKKRSIEQAVAQRLDGRRVYLDTPRFVPYIPPGDFTKEPLIAPSQDEALKAKLLSDRAPLLKALYDAFPIITRVYVERGADMPPKEYLLEILFDVWQEMGSETQKEER